MNKKLFNLLSDTITNGLKRKSIDTCSKWANAYRVMGNPFPGPWSFKYHPWLKDMHDSEAELNIGQKAAQVGFTETALNRVLYNIDVKATDCLYILPAVDPDASVFSASRFDPALELSPHLMNLFSSVKNVGHKRAGSANLYVRGSKSRSALKSIPVGLIILDEVDEMVQDNIALAMERTAGQLERMVWAISTPTVPNDGINRMYTKSTQEHFFFKCPSCSRLTELLWPECFELCGDDLNDPRIEQSYIKCKECQNKLNDKTRFEWLEGAKWVPGYTDKDARGFHVNQLYSSTVSGIPSNIAKSYFESLIDPSKEQEFYNSKLGIPHIVSNAQITDGDIQQCIGEYKKGQIPRSGLLTLGVDVGKWLHYIILLWNVKNSVGTDYNTNSNPKLVDFGKLKHFDELDKLMKDWRITAGVVDSQPEPRSVLQFANRWFGHIKKCYYTQGINGKEIHVSKQEDHTLHVDRTAWLDLTLSRMKKQTIAFPFDIDLEFRDHMKALVRVYKKDKDGNQIGRYENGNNADHYAHALNYAEIALPISLSIGSITQDIRSPV